ncbi:hypothetical protein I3760_02G185100 [Carya illinoinensis]|nr:hypothetical protein I3760_02G185100 [Carya illinoinensis]
MLVENATYSTSINVRHYYTLMGMSVLFGGTLGNPRIMTYCCLIYYNWVFSFFYFFSLF